MRINLFLTSVLMLVSTSLFAQFTQVNGNYPVILKMAGKASMFSIIP